MRITTALLLIVLAATSTGCNRTVTLVEPEKEIFTDVLTGTVGPAVGGVGQGVNKSFTVGQGGGAVTVTLTTALLTLPDGSTDATVTMGLGVGTFQGEDCIVPITAFVQTRAGSTPQLAGSLNEGTYCVRVSDVTMQQGSVAFSVTVTHT